MTLNEMLKKKMYEEIWDSYIGFLNLSLKDYMIIQERLLQEQIDLYYKCELGKRFF